jgi:hypothetical protein
LLLRPLAITAMLVAGFAITASGASAAKTPGIWTVGPGKTLEVEFMTLQAHDLDTAYVYVDLGEPQEIQYLLGSNLGHQDGFPGVTLPDFSYTNTGLTTHTVTLDLSDATAGCDSFSSGPNAFASPLRVTPANRSTSGLRELSDAIDINDGETHLNCAGQPYGPFGDSSNFDGRVVITRTP